MQDAFLEMAIFFRGGYIKKKPPQQSWGVNIKEDLIHESTIMLKL